MAPHTLYVRASETSTSASPSDSSTSSSSDTSSSGSFMDKHGKQVYIALAVIGGLLLLILIWAYSKNRLSFPPFNQKRCATCKRGISRSDRFDKDYFEDGRSGRFKCRKCQEEEEDKDIEKELDSDGLRTPQDETPKRRDRDREVKSDETGREPREGSRKPREGDRDREARPKRRDGDVSKDASEKHPSKVREGRRPPSRKREEVDTHDAKPTRKKHDSDDSESD
ncbi:hypothetical protein L204_100036 [Cryptococcus depauperatus]|nr:hypothetical protein L204_02483 [Cryptococcus depauperatus CBS 7855]